MLPVTNAWFEPVLIASIAVFIVALVANVVTFSSRLASSLLTAILFAAAFGAATYYGYGNVRVTISQTPDPAAPGAKR